mmetsp:Transcript_3560/g.10395  ORF Transcript_3560/g.10395 Transcript_3560/m.10395 type:complete len:430 (+) Transcript_3560:729-2018(+)
MRQVHDVVHRVADHDDTGDRLTDSQVPIHRALAEAEHAEHDGSDGEDGIDGEHDVPCGREEHDESDGDGNGATLEESGEQFLAEVEAGEDLATKLDALERCRCRRPSLRDEGSDEVGHLLASGKRRDLGHCGPDLDDGEPELAIHDADVLLVVNLAVQKLAGVGCLLGVVAESDKLRQKVRTRGQGSVAPSLEVAEEARVTSAVRLQHQFSCARVVATRQVAWQFLEPLASVQHKLLCLGRAKIESTVELDLTGLLLGIVDVDIGAVQAFDTPEDFDHCVPVVGRCVEAAAHEIRDLHEHVVLREPHLLCPRRRELRAEINALNRHSEHDKRNSQGHRPCRARLPLHRGDVHFVEKRLHNVQLLLLDRRSSLCRLGLFTQPQARATTPLALNVLVPDDHEGGRECDCEDIVEKNRDRGVPTTSPHWHRL